MAKAIEHGSRHFTTVNAVRLGKLAAALHPNLDEFTDAFLVQDLRIMGKDTAFDVVWQNMPASSRPS
jgi:hypothetical protein